MSLRFLYIAFTLLAIACQPNAPSPASRTVASASDTLTPIPTYTHTFTATSTPFPTAAPSPTSTPTPPPIPKPNIGLQGQYIDPDGDAYIAWAAETGVGWIKQQVDWNLVEYAPGEYRWEELDHFIDQAQAHHFKILLSIAKAPGFSRSEPVEEDGPPDDFTIFNRFMLALSSRYQGRVAAYELWNEPNLRREWRGHDLSAATFVALLGQGAHGVRQGDPSAIIISAAPGPTGIHDGVNAIDDRVYLRAMLAAGLAQWVDAIGAHPYAAANPPGERASDPTHKASGYNNHPSFFFLDTLEDYHAILLEFGVDKPIWVTEFGWPSIDAFGDVDTSGWEYARAVSEFDQSAYLLEAIRLRRDRPWLGPMMIWNLNVAPLFGPERPESAYSLIRPDASRRPAYTDLRNSGE
jgi:hypothetical protein